MQKIILLLNLFLFSIPLLAHGAIKSQAADNPYTLIMQQPSALNVPGAQNEVQGFAQYNNNLYIGYMNDNSNPYLDTSPIYTWNGSLETPFYTLGKGNDFSGAGAIQSYNGNLYFGNQTGYDGANSGCVYAYNPSTTPVNFIQSVPNLGGGMSTPAVTIANDSNNNGIFGSSSFSVEYYGRIDDLGGSQGGYILEKTSSSTGGYALAVGANNTITATIYAGGVAGNTKTNPNAFTLGNYHDIIFSWTSGSNPIIYIDGVAASLASTASVTTPGNDTNSSLYMSDSPGDAYGQHSYGGTYRRVRIWRNYAVSPSDASTLAQGGTISNAPTGQYLFTEGLGITTADSSGNGNTGTITSPNFWNSTLVDLSFCSGNDQFIYGFTVFNGKLYAGAGYSTSRIYSYNGTTNIWATAYPGLPGYGLVVSLYVYDNLLFAALGGSSGGAIISSPDGDNWTTETTVPPSITSEFNRFVVFNGNLYAGIINAGAATGDIYERSSTGTWSAVNTSPSCGQVWGMNDYSNVLYAGCTTTGGATIYKSYDGLNFTQDFQVPNANQTEAFNMINDNGALYIGLGFNNSTAGVIYRKIEPQIAVTNPPNGSSLTAGSNVTITSTASETLETIANISLFNAGGVYLGSSGSSPYNYTLTNILPGNYSFYATATDVNGVSSTSSPVAFTAITPILPSLPVVAITNPANGSSFPAGISGAINAAASETNGSIAKVSFYYNGTNYLGTIPSSPYNLNVSDVPAGVYTLTAVATDANGVTATSNPVTVTITNPTPPSLPVVAITSPLNGSNFKAGSNITIAATASETNGSIAKVAFYNDGVYYLGSSTTAPYNITVNSVPAGNYSVTAVATDANGVTATSAAIGVTFK